MSDPASIRRDVVAGGHRLECVWRPAAAENADPVLVFLHEGLGSVALWKDFPATVGEAVGASVLVYSRAGYGDSENRDTPYKPDYMHQEAIAVLPEILAAFDIENPILIGHSDGASIALIHAGAFPDKIAGVVALAPHVFVEDMSIAAIAAAKIAFETTDLAQRLAAYHADPDGAFRQWNDIWLDPAFADWEISDSVAQITAPILTIQGLDDQYGTLAQLDRIENAAAATTVRRVDLASCGHAPHRDQPETTRNAIVSFCRTHSDGAMRKPFR